MDERNKVMVLGILGFTWFLIIFAEAAGIFTVIFGDVAFIIIRMLLAILNLLLSVTWVGWKNVREMLGGFKS